MKKPGRKANSAVRTKQNGIDFTFKPLSITRILVPVDFSELTGIALQKGAAMAKELSASILLLHVVESIIYPVDSSFIVPPNLEQTNLHMVKSAREHLARLSLKLQEMGLATEGRVVVGRAYERIVSVAKQSRCQLIVIPTHGWTGLKHFALGSTAEKVVRYAPCSVLVARQFSRG
jgi:nucleotide-binding universal stress UspA family protein